MAPLIHTVPSSSLRPLRLPTLPARVPLLPPPCLQGRSCQVVGKRVIYQDEVSGGEVFHVELSLDRGVPWDAVLAFK